MENEIINEVKAVYEVFDQFRILVRDSKWSDMMRSEEIAKVAIELTKLYIVEFYFDVEE